MKSYKDLNEKEKQQLLKYPAYISLLASTAEGSMDEQEKKTAVKLTHVKTFSSDPLLSEFYKEAEKIFEANLNTLNKELPAGKEERMAAISKELEKLEPLVKKLDPEYASLLRRSMASYKQHISRAHRNVLEYFIFPVPIDGLSD